MRCLCFAVVLDWVVSRVVCVEINFVLGGLPLGVDRDAVGRHRGEGIRRCAGLIREPTEEDIAVPVAVIRLEIVSPALSVGRDVRAVIHQSRLAELASGGLFGRSAAAVNVDAVEISDRLLDSFITDFKLISCISIPEGFRNPVSIACGFPGAPMGCVCCTPRIISKCVQCEPCIFFRKGESIRVTHISYIFIGAGIVAVAVHLIKPYRVTASVSKVKIN